MAQRFRRRRLTNEASLDGVRKYMLGVAAVVGALTFFPTATIAGEPEYMKVEPRVGVTLEIKGRVNDEGHFVATDLEELDKPRSPKLRGSIGTVDIDGSWLSLFGRKIIVTEDTEFEGGQSSIDGLASGMRIEVSCKVDDGEQWRARKIKTGDVKASNKIKGTITKAIVDGAAPDTVEVSGLVIILDEDTDVDEGAQLNPLEKTLYGELAWIDARGLDRGVVLADGRLFLSGELRHNYRSESDFTLTRQFQSDLENMEPQIRVKASAYLGSKVRAFAQARVRKRYVISSDQNLESGAWQGEFIQLYALWRDILVRRLAFQVGRQRFKEPRQWLYDEYLTAVRVLHHSEKHLVLEGAVIRPFRPLNDKFKTWTDFLGVVRWYTDEKSHLSAYVLARSDSDVLRNRQPVWSGVRYYGDIHRVFRPWADVSMMTGEDKGETLRAWAVDFGGTVIARPLPLSPSLTLAYAYGSGDDTSSDDIDHEYRQTGYQDNVARFGGVASVKYYGTVLNPELSNLEVLTFAAGIRTFRRSSVEVVYHRYRQPQPDDKVRGSDLVDPPARPNSASSDIGWGADMVVTFPKVVDHIRIKWTLGMFRPGEAFSPRREDAFLNRIELRIAF